MEAKSFRSVLALLNLSFLVITFNQNPAFSFFLNLTDNCRMESSVKITETGDAISTNSFQPATWYPVTLPSTVLAGLVANDVYQNPFYGENLASIPNSEFINSWWYRMAFIIPASEAGKKIWLNFSGINYRANIWLNGEKIADSAEVVGAYRTYEFDVTGKINTGNDSNVIAVEVYRCEANDLAINFVDWAPHPPDSSMGIFKPVYIRTSGEVKLRHPHVISELDTPSLSTAKLTVLAEVTNGTDASVTGTLQGSIGTISFSKSVTLGANEKKELTFSHNDFSQLVITNPSVWWPWQMGDQPLYTLDLAFKINDILSDSLQIQFGIRQVTSNLKIVNNTNYRYFSVNGKDILIRGAGWCPDLFLRRDPKRIEAEIKYVRDMNLNTIRLEGKLEEKDFYDLCDKYGILVMAGWCCSYLGTGWEKWEWWDTEDRSVAYASTRSQIYRHRFHPCIIAWLYASDRLPPSSDEQVFLDILEELSWPNPSMASAGSYTSTITGATGVKMSGPYKWEPPTYWFQDSLKGGYFCFNTEAGPGAAVPPLESIREFIPANNLWPIDNVWNYHCGIEHFKDLRVFTEAVDNRYGASQSAREYCMKAQVAAYESHRAMFEAYSQNKYTSTGIIQWMLNNAWPSMIWHLYDYYLRPGGSYFGSKMGCKPLHIQYSVNDRFVTVVNSYYINYSNLNAEAYVYTLDGEEKFHQEATVSLNPDEVKKTFAIPEFDTISSTYFLRLILENENGDICDNNSYWLSLKGDTVDWQNDSGYFTQTSSFADFTALQGLDTVAIDYSMTFKPGSYEDTVTVTVNNPTSIIAFAAHLKLIKAADKKEILPVLWEDNYFMLYPGEKREIVARYRTEDAGGTVPELVIDGWNAKGGVTKIQQNLNKFIPAVPYKYTCTFYNLLGRRLFEYTSKTHVKKAISAFQMKNLSFWKPRLAAGVYVVRMKKYYKTGKQPVISKQVMVRF